VASLYREDAVEMPPGKPPVPGRTAIEAYYREFFSTCRFTDFALTHSELRAEGDVGYVVGTSRQTLSPGGGAPLHDTGKYLVVLKRTGGEWKVAYAIYNVDHVPAPPVVRK
jgi:ketosteroid isomerase-like protein